MKKIKRVLACLLAICISIGMVSCTSKETPTSTPNTFSTDTPAKPVDIWGKYDEPVTITTVLPSNNAAKFNDGESYDKNPWYDQFKEKFNIDVKNLWVAGTSADYKTKLNLSIADGSLPDVFVVSSVGVLNQLIDSGVASDITEVFNTYASEDIKGYMESNPDTYNTALRDGKMYGIPQLSYGIIDQPNQIWIRKDWKEEQKIADPKTMDEVFAMAKIFKEKYGALGLGEDQTLFGMKIIAPAWGAYPGIWIDTPSGIEYGSVQPEMKDVLTAYSKLYKDGLVYPDFITSDNTKMTQTNINGKTGIQPFEQWWAWIGADVVANLGKDSIFQAYTIPSANGKAVKAPIKFANYGYIVINSKCKNPDAAMKLFNYFGKVEFKGDEDPEILKELQRVTSIVPYSFRVFDPQTDYNQFIAIAEALKTGDASKLLGGATTSKYNICVDFMKNGTISSVGTYLQCGDEKSAYRVSKEMLDSSSFIKDILWGNSPQTLTDSGSTLDDILIQGFTQIIVGEEPVEYFDKLVESWKSAGGKQATKEMNEIYGKK